MPPAGFEPTIPGLERAKIFRALDHVATLIGATSFVIILKTALIRLSFCAK
jgi:hypothetical protein